MGGSERGGRSSSPGVCVRFLVAMKRVGTGWEAGGGKLGAVYHGFSCAARGFGWLLSCACFHGDNVLDEE